MPDPPAKLRPLNPDPLPMPEPPAKLRPLNPDPLPMPEPPAKLRPLNPDPLPMPEPPEKLRPLNPDPPLKPLNPPPPCPPPCPPPPPPPPPRASTSPGCVTSSASAKAHQRMSEDRRDAAHKSPHEEKSRLATSRREHPRIGGLQELYSQMRRASPKILSPHGLAHPPMDGGFIKESGKREFSAAALPRKIESA